MHTSNTIEYINGTANNCADCMSRLPLSGQAPDSAEKCHVVVQMDDSVDWNGEPLSETKVAGRP